jgi:hypothetical protein
VCAATRETKAHRLIGPSARAENPNPDHIPPDGAQDLTFPYADPVVSRLALDGFVPLDL